MKLTLALVALGFVAQPLFAQTSTNTPAELQQRGDAYVVDLPTVLRLADAQNLDIQIARERLNEARANETSATWQFFPYISPGITYRKHEGRVQAVDGQIFDASKASLAPGITLGAQVDLGEAYYKRLAALQQVKAADHAVNAQRQQSAFAATQNFFDLLFAQAAVEVARAAIRVSTNYSYQIDQAVAAGVAFRGDALRVNVQTERYQLTLRQTLEQQRAAAARLAQSLNLDPTINLVPQTSDLVPLKLIESDAPMKALVQDAFANRPELRQNQATLAAAQETHKGSICGPMVPTVGAQLFHGGLGGGTGGNLSNWGDQHDFFLGLSWRIGSGGMFDSGRTKAAESRVKTAELGYEKLHDEIAREVVDAAIRVNSLREQIAVAQRAVKAADDGMRLANQRKEFAVGIVLETIQAEQDLTRARFDYLRTISEYNKAQYALQKALGKM